MFKKQHTAVVVPLPLPLLVVVVVVVALVVVTAGGAGGGGGGVLLRAQGRKLEAQTLGSSKKWTLDDRRFGKPNDLTMGCLN